MKSKGIAILLCILLISVGGYFCYKQLRQADVKLDTSVAKITTEDLQKEDTKSVTKEDVKEIVRDEVSKNPEIVVKAIESHIKNQQQEEEKKINKVIQDNKNALMGNSNDPVYGNPAAKSTIVNYYDYNCSHCKKMSHVIKKLVSENQDVYIVFKELPILGEASTKASTAALAINKIAPSKYLDFHFALIEDYSTDSIDQKIKKVAKSLGINIVQLYKEMDNKEIKTILKNNIELASEISIRGIPAFIINGQLYPSSMNYEQMLEVLEKSHEDNTSNIVAQEVPPATTDNVVTEKGVAPDDSRANVQASDGCCGDKSGSEK